MKYLAPMANSLGWEVEGSATAIMALGDAGIQGSMAGQAFATSLGRLTDESGKAAKTAEELGMEFFDASGRMKSMPEIIAELETGLDGMNDKQRAAALTAIFGAEAYKHWGVLLERGSEDLGKMEEGLINSKDAAKDMREEMENNLKGDWAKFNAALQETAIVIYKNLQPALRKMVQSFTKVVEWLGNLNPAVQASIIKFVALLAVIGPLILVFGKFASAIGSIIGMTSTFVKAFAVVGKTLSTVAKVATKVAPAFLKLGKSIKNLFNVARLIPLIFSPWGIAIAAALGFIFIFKDQIIALGKALWEFISGPVVEALGNIPSFIGDLITGLVDGIKLGLGAIWEAAKEIGRALIDGFKEILGIQSPSTVFRELGTWVIQGLIDGIKSMVNGVLEIIRFLVDAMIEDIKGLVDAYIEVFTNLKDAVIEIVGTMVEWVVTKITEFKDLIVEIVTELVGWFIDKFIELKDKVVELIIELVNTVIEWLTHLVQSIKEFAVEMVNAIVNAFNDMWDAASEFVSKAWELGRDFVMGIAEGIKNGVGWMKDAISFVVDSAIQWFKSKFDIRSPSRVMMSLSEYIPMGVASGIEKRTPDVEYAMDKLSNKAIKQAKALANFNLSELFASGGLSKDATRKAILPKKGTARKLHNFGGAGAWDVPTDKKGSGSVTVNVRRLENANAKAIQNKVEKNFFKKARQRE